MLIREIRDLTSIFEEEGIMSTGSMGQRIVHPALRERRAAIEALRKLEATFSPLTHEDEAEQFVHS